MKKLLIIFSVLLLFSNCSSKEQKTEKVRTAENTFRTIFEFKYKNHSYIGFGGHAALGVVHNPDCSCSTQRTSYDSYYSWGELVGVTIKRL